MVTCSCLTILGQKASVLGVEGDSKVPIDYACFHSPFCRLVAKSFAWLALQDAKIATSTGNNSTSNAGDVNGQVISEGVKSIVDQLAPVVHAADR